MRPASIFSVQASATPGPTVVRSPRRRTRIGLGLALTAHGACFTAFHAFLTESQRFSLAGDSQLYLLNARAYAKGYSVPGGPVRILWTNVYVRGPMSGGVPGAAFSRAVGWLMSMLDSLSSIPPAFLTMIAAAACSVAALHLAALVAARNHRSVDGFWLVTAVGVYPSALYFTSVALLRDGWIYLAFLTGIAAFAQICWNVPLRTDRRAIRFAGSVLLGASSFMILTSLREYATVAIVVGTALWLATTRDAPIFGRQRDWRLGAIAFIVAAMIGANRVASLFPRIRGKLTPSGVARYRASYPDSTSNLDIDLRGASPLKYAALWVYSTVSNAIGPLPFQVRNLAMAAFMVEGMALCFVIWLIWRGRSRLDARGRLVLCIAGSWFAVIGLFNDNLGTAARLRVPGWILLMCLAQALHWSGSRRDPLAHDLG